MKHKVAGFSLVEVMISLFVLSGLGVGAMYIGSQQSKGQLGLAKAGDLSRSFNLMRNVLGDPKACEYNFKDKELGQSLDKLFNSKGEVSLSVGDTFANKMYVLTGIKIGEHSTAGERTRVILTYHRTSDATRSKILSKSFDVFSRVSGTKVVECLDPSKLTAEGSMLMSCYDMDPLLQGDCEKNFDNVLKQMKELYCKNHPFLEFDPATLKCKPLDAGKSCSGQYVQGYDANGGLRCYPGPSSTAPPIPDPVLPPTIACTGYSDWGPSTDLTCEGVSFTQSRTCNSTGEVETRTATGTKKDGVCSSVCSGFSDWGPATDLTCMGTVFTQSRTCTSTGEVETRTATGTKTGGTCVSVCADYSEWFPSPEFTCEGQAFTQTRSCSSGASDTETRSALGTKKDGTCLTSKDCKNYSDWVPSTDLTCVGKTFTQSRTCNDTGELETRASLGTKSDVTCCEKWGSWLPLESSQCLGMAFQQTRTCQDPGLTGLTDIQTKSGSSTGSGCCGDWTPSTDQTCPDQTVTQTNSCPGQTQTVKGTKADCSAKGCIFRRPFSFSGGGSRLGGNMQCVEYFCAAGNPACIGEMQMEDGEVFWGTVTYCFGAGADTCHGSFKVTCNNGSLSITNEFCTSGAIP